MKKHTKTKLAKICIFSMALSVFSSITPPRTTFADTWPDTDEAHIKSAQPHFSGYRVRDAEVWNKNTDPYSDLMQAKVPLQTRNTALPETQANPGLHSKTEVMLMQADYGNSFFDSTIANNAYGNVAFPFWQYTDYFCPWHGAATIGTPRSLYDPATSDWRARGFEFGIINIPNQAYINAAHKNGVKAIACIYFDPAFRPGQTKDEMFVKDTDGNFVVAKKLVEMAHYYGFDGYFLNNEEADDERFKDFMAYLSEQGMYTQFYDTNSNFDKNKSQHLKNDQHHKIHDSVFVNYGWNGVNQFVAHAAEIGVDPHKAVFLGIEGNQGKFTEHHNSLVKESYTSETDKNPLCSIALFTPSDMYQRGIDDLAEKLGLKNQFPIHQRPEYQWMVAERERMYFSGVTCNPKDTGSKQGFSRGDVYVDDASYWPGVADFKAETSVIRGNKFFSTFNIGKGMQYFVNGSVANNEAFTDLNDQDILPTWQWWFESSSKSLKADFDFGEKEIRKNTDGQNLSLPFKQVGAYQGGSSLVIYGPLQAEHTLKLFKTDLQLTNSSKAKIAFRKTSDDSATMKLGLRFKDNLNLLTPIEIEHSSVKSDSFVEKTLDLSAYANKEIASIELIFEGNSENYQINIGSIAISDNFDSLTAPSGFKIERIYQDKQMIFSWNLDSYDTVDKYRVYAESNGTVHFLGGIFGDKLYVKNHFFGNNEQVTFRLVKVSKDGTESMAAEQIVDFSKLPSTLTITETNGAYGKQAAVAGELSLNFDTNHPVAHTISVTPVFVANGQPSINDVNLDASTKTTTIPTPSYLNGEEYDLTVTPAGEQVGLSYRGRFHDSVTESLSKDEVLWVGYKKLALRSPLIRDWKQLSVTFKTDETAEITSLANQVRGTSTNYHAAFDLPSDKGTITATITDYNGNKKDFIIPYDESFKKELISLKEKYKPIVENETLAKLLYLEENREATINSLKTLLENADKILKTKVAGAVEDTLSAQKVTVNELITSIKDTVGNFRENQALADFSLKLKLPNITQNSVSLTLNDADGNTIPHLHFTTENTSSEDASLTYHFKLEKGKTYTYQIDSYDDMIKAEKKTFDFTDNLAEEVSLTPMPYNLMVQPIGANTCKRGERIELSNYNVVLTYQSSAQKTLPLSDSSFTVSDYNTDTLGEKEVEFSYFEVPGRFTIQVIPNDTDPAEVTLLQEELKEAKILLTKAEYLYATDEKKEAFVNALSAAEDALTKNTFDQAEISSLLNALKQSKSALDGLSHKPLIPEITTTYTPQFSEEPELNNMVDGKIDTYALFEKQKAGDFITFTYPREINLKKVEIIYSNDPNLAFFAPDGLHIQSADIEILSGSDWTKVGSLKDNTLTEVTLNDPMATTAFRIKITEDADPGIFAISEVRAKFEEIQAIPDPILEEKRKEIITAVAAAIKKKESVHYQIADLSRKKAFDAALQSAESLMNNQSASLEQLSNALRSLEEASASLNGLNNLQIQLEKEEEEEEEAAKHHHFEYPVVPSEKSKTPENTTPEVKETEKQTSENTKQEEVKTPSKKENKIQQEQKKSVTKEKLTKQTKKRSLIKQIENYSKKAESSKRNEFKSLIHYLKKAKIKTESTLKKRLHKVLIAKKKLLKQKNSMSKKTFAKKRNTLNMELKKLKQIKKMMEMINK